jgi:hypothetical protein
LVLAVSITNLVIETGPSIYVFPDFSYQMILQDQCFHVYHCHVLLSALPLHYIILVYLFLRLGLFIYLNIFKMTPQ